MICVYLLDVMYINTDANPGVTQNMENFSFLFENDCGHILNWEAIFSFVSNKLKYIFTFI